MLAVVGLILSTKVLYNYVNFTRQPDPFNNINQLLIKTDIQSKLMRVRQFLKDVCIEEESSSIQLAIQDLEESMTTINSYLEQLLTTQKCHQSLYFSQWRSTNVSTLLTNLELVIYQFDHRFKDLLLLYQLMSYQ